MKTIKQQVAVMLAADEGKAISVIPHNGDDTVLYPSNHAFDWNLNDYDIVEEPWKGWANVYPDGKIGASYETKKETENHCCGGGRTIKVREVIE